MDFFMIVPILYFLFIIAAVLLFFRILYGIWRSNLDRNEILKGIHEELKNGRL
jgi:hypothetical protein